MKNLCIIIFSFSILIFVCCNFPSSASTKNALHSDAKSAPMLNTDNKILDQKIAILYFTDPICSACWGIEPSLRRLNLEYGDQIEIKYHMGGLLKDWNYNSGGISKPLDVKHHWDEVAGYYDMPIDGDVWIEDPLASSFPPSIAFKAAEIQDKTKALIFLRRMREMVFLEKKNICHWKHIEEAAKYSGLEIIKLKKNYETNAKSLFEADLQRSATLRVRGFPTLFISTPSGSHELIYGNRDYASIIETIKKVKPDIKARQYSRDWKDLFHTYSTMTTREFMELSQINKEDAKKQLSKLLDEKKITEHKIKNGSLWKIAVKD